MQNSNDAVAALIRDANIEVIPLKGIDLAVRGMPPGATVTITCSPKLGLGRTLEHVRHARAAGYRVVPHLAARQVADTAELRAIVGVLADLGVDDLFVVGGDVQEPVGAFRSAIELLEELASIEHPFRRVGVTAYPEGHPLIADADLADALRAKQTQAQYMVSQLCFDAETVVAWGRRMRSAGITLPWRIGLAAPVNMRKLLELSLKIGVGSSVRYLSKQNGVLSNIVFSRAYDPRTLLDGIGGSDNYEDLGIEGVHLFSFNQINATLKWQRALVEGMTA
jgi:methylenetetrahydrofolate reductase (NADPH)